jgi:hypothetical protein
MLGHARDTCGPTPSSELGALLVRKRCLVYSHKVRLRIYLELHRENCRSTLELSLGNPMHSIHHATIGSQDDGVSKVRVEDQLSMVCHRAAGSVPAAATKPEWFVELTNRFERHRPLRQMLGQVDESVNVPCEKPQRRRAKVILLPHCWNG